MRKRELAALISDEVGLPPRDVSKVLDSLFRTLADTLLEHERLELTGFGVFHVQHQKERRTYVPKRKETVVIPARRTIKFKEVKELKERLNPRPVAIEA